MVNNIRGILKTCAVKAPGFGDHRKAMYNAATDSYGDLVEMGVLDPTKVTRCALQNAASVAALIVSGAHSAQRHPAHLLSLHERTLSKKMQRISEILQLPVIVEWRRPLLLEPQPLQKLDLLLGRIPTE